MKNLVFSCLLILTFGCTTTNGILKRNKRTLKSTREIVRFDRFSRMATIGGTQEEKVQSVYLYDKNRNLIKKFEDIKVNKFTLSVQGVYLINVVTNKGLHIKVIK